MFTKESNNFKSGNLKIFYDIYIPKEQNGILIQIAHGMVEHKGKYEYFASKLACSGYIIAINDHRGHGDSIGENIYLGEMGENGFEMALLDMYEFQNILKERFKPKQFVLFGHSMGSLLARRFLQEYEKDIDLLILCGTPKPYFAINPRILFLKICRFLRINNMSRKIAHKFIFLTFNKKFNKFDKLDNGKISGVMWVNRDKNQLLKYLNDEKCRFIFTTNSFINLICGVKKVFGKYQNIINKHNMPIIFISGEDDACGGFGKGVLEAFKHLNKQGYNNIKCILYSGARHELYLELNKDEFIRDIINFIKENL